MEIAVLKERIEGVRLQNKAQFEVMQGDIHSLKNDIKELLDFMNKSKGGLRVILAASAASGAAAGTLVKLLTYMISIR